MSVTNTILISIVTGLASALFVHFLTKSRDIKNKKDELRIKYLIEAYRKLENLAHRENPSISDFESAIADIQLFGTDKQVQLAQATAHKFAENRTVSLDVLLEDLRDDLRTLLKLESLSSKKLIHLRWKQ